MFKLLITTLQSSSDRFWKEDKTKKSFIFLSVKDGKIPIKTAITKLTV